MVKTYYKVTNQEIKNGQASIRLPATGDDGLTITAGAYNFKIRYETNNIYNQDAAQYERTLIIGHRPNFEAKDIIQPWSTSATTESGITTTQKENTTITGKVTVTYQNNGNPVPNLDLKLGFGVGDDTNYKASTITNTNTYNGYANSTKIGTITTNSNGEATFSFKLSDVVSDVTQITNATSKTYSGKTAISHTLFIRCLGTTTLGNKNVVPGTITIPVSIGTAPVIVGRTLTPHSDSNSSIARTCPGGNIRIKLTPRYFFAFNRDNYSVLEGYEEYVSETAKLVRTGKIEIQLSPDGETWSNIPETDLEIESTTSNAKVTSDGVVTIGTSGVTTILYRNHKANSYTGTIHIRYRYVGVVGKTQTTSWAGFKLEINPSYNTYTAVPTTIYINGDSTLIWQVENESTTQNVQIKRDDTGETILNSGTLSYEVTD